MIGYKLGNDFIKQGKLKMKVMLSSIGKFHTFDMARELSMRGLLGGIFTGYPNFKLKKENLPKSLVHTFPYLHATYMKFPYWDLLGNRVKKEWEYWDMNLFDQYVSKNIQHCDVFSGLSGSGLKTGKVVKARGGIYVCDRGSTHIRIQDQILREEHQRWGLAYNAIDPRIIEREEAEYELADAITVPSSFVYQTFIESGVAPQKLHLIPYGVNLEKFHKMAEPCPVRFDILFVGGGSLRKGVIDLLQAYAKVRHPFKTLTMVGSFSSDIIKWLKKMNVLSHGINITGHMPQEKLKEIMSRSHVMVLPSVEEGLAMVQAQAMACGCPVIATKNTGAQNLYVDQKEGFIVPIRQPNIIAEKLQYLADHPDIRKRMSILALAKVREMGGWRTYGDMTASMLKNAMSKKHGPYLTNDKFLFDKNNH